MPKVSARVYRIWIRVLIRYVAAAHAEHLMKQI